MTALFNLDKTNDTAKQAFLIRITCFFWLLGKLASYKSWIADRSLPTVALFEFFDALPNSVHIISFLVSILLIVAIIAKPLKILIQLFMVVEIFSVLLDVLRIQPWEYLYLFIIGFYITFKQSPAIFYKCLLLIIAATYIFSGLHKFNAAFLHTTWDNFFLRKVFGFSDAQIPAGIHYAGVFFSVGEFLLGILLLATKRKSSTVIALITMHLFLIVVNAVISAQPANSIVPWNILMIFILLYILKHSYKNQYSLGKPLGLPKLSSCIILLFWYVLPFSNIFGFWALPLSSGMYTGKPPRVYICWDDFGKKHIPVQYSLNSKPTKFCNNGRLLLLSNWTHLEATQAPFPAVWYYERLYKRLKEKYPNDAIKMVYTYYPFIHVTEIR